MAILSANEIFYTAFEPKVANRFVMYLDGIPAYFIKGVSGVEVVAEEIKLPHINVVRKVKGRNNWSDVSLTLYDAITPSGAQAVMEWVRLHHESVTGRDGYSDFYKKDLTLDIIGPVGDIVSEWILKGAFIKSAKWSDLNYDTDAEAANITLNLAVDYCVLNF